ncbi:hypothetical protein [Nodularia sp. NIES-3585]|uniref:hypothetical protein n=1 Tax=Nodularia sp. NIES-3585 TaxID=1973477 RepID=UPI000B5C624D|nr:hypothetical protein [Nodularia sp. NIES-3585]GAX35953.1 hypothetical protein NIES3585_19720 [Nodularia sp. NIES-3585]
MCSNNSSPLRLQVWRSCRWKKEFLDTNKNDLADVTAFQECLYSWEPVEHPFGSITSGEQTQRLTKELIENFSLGIKPEERGIEQFKKVIQVIDDILSHENESAWSDLEEFGHLSNYDSVNLRQHRLLALRQHIQWVCDTFANVPDISISLR